MSEDKQSTTTASTSSTQPAGWKKYLNKLAFWQKDKNKKAHNKVQLIPKWALLLLLAVILAWIFLVIFLPVYYATTTNDTTATTTTTTTTTLATTTSDVTTSLQIDNLATFETPVASIRRKRSTNYGVDTTSLESEVTSFFQAKGMEEGASLTTVVFNFTQLSVNPTSNTQVIQMGALVTMRKRVSGTVLDGDKDKHAINADNILTSYIANAAAIMANKPAQASTLTVPASKENMVVTSSVILASSQSTTTVATTIVHDPHATTTVHNDHAATTVHDDHATTTVHDDHATTTVHDVHDRRRRLIELLKKLVIKSI